MKRLLFYIGYGILYLLSLIPFWLMYIISDFAAFLMGQVFQYRRRVIDSNLRIAFPNFSEKEIKKTRNDFYQRFCDNFLETVKLISINQKQLEKRFITNTELLHRLYRETDKNITLVLGHFFNWEMANPAIALHSPFQQLIVYRKVSSNFFEQVMIKVRERFNAMMIDASEFSSSIRKIDRKRFALVLAADQNPPYGTVPNAYWASFFGKVVPFAKGPERTAMIADTVVVFGKIYRTKRGQYHNTLTLVTDNARSSSQRGEITKQIIRLIEENIQDDPANYLWSHRRFRHEYKEEYKKNLIE